MSMVDGSVVELWNRDARADSRIVDDWKRTADLLRRESRADSIPPKKNAVSAREKYEAIASPLFDALLTMYENLVRWFWPERLPTWAKFSIARDGDVKGVCGSSIDDDGTPRISINANRFIAASKLDGVILQQIVVVLLRAIFHAVVLKSGGNDSEEEWNSVELTRLGFVGRPFEWNVYADSPVHLAYGLLFKKMLGKNLRFDRLLKAYRSCSEEERNEIDMTSDVLLSVDCAISHGVKLEDLGICANK